MPTLAPPNLLTSIFFVYALSHFIWYSTTYLLSTFDVCTEWPYPYNMYVKLGLKPWFMKCDHFKMIYHMTTIKWCNINWINRYLWHKKTIESIEISICCSSVAFFLYWSLVLSQMKVHKNLSFCVNFVSLSVVHFEIYSPVHKKLKFQ